MKIECILSFFITIVKMTTVGVKGSDVYTADGIENPLVALSVQLVRGVGHDTVRDGIEKTLKDIQSRTLEDLFVLVFQTRDIRGGKGERAAAMAMWSALLTNDVTKPLALDLLDLVPEYGCWQDLFKMDSIAWSRVLVIVKKQFLMMNLECVMGVVRLF